MIKVVVDTNTILSGMMGYRSPERKLLSLSLLKKIQFLSCSEIAREFSEKVRMPRVQRYWQKYYFSPDKIIQDYLALMVMHEPTPFFQTKEVPIRDPDDAIFFKLALSSDAKIIISKDKDLLVLNNFEGIKVTTPEKFIEVYDKNISP